MRTLLKLIGALVALALAAVVGLGVLVALDDRPLVAQARTLTAAERAWAARWIRNARPPGLEAGAAVTLTVSQAQANTLAAYLIDRLGPGRVAVAFAPGRARLALSMGLPWQPQERFFNAELELRTDQGLPRIARARLAGLPMPAGVAQALAERLLTAIDQSGLIRQVEFRPDLARITYEWQPGALGRLAGGLVPAAERARILEYQALLVEYGAAHPKAAAVPLTDLLTLVLAAAARAGDADPAAENRAALFALAAWVNGQPIRDPAAPRTGDAPSGSLSRPEARLRGRHDLARHFMTSAALATQGGNAVADLVGFMKEAADSRHGSGFSFADLTADRAGTRLGDLAGGTRQSARTLQEAAARGLTEADLMPDITGLPEGLSARAFAAAFRDTQSPAYRRITEHIERRIDALPLFQ